jgi:hypothetical protein
VADLAFLAAQKRWGLDCLSVPIYIIMFPQFYQNHLEKQLKSAQYHTLKALVYLLQIHKQVSITLVLLSGLIRFNLRVGGLAYKDF